MLDEFVLQAALTDIRDAVSRIRSVLPPDFAAFRDDRTKREVVVLNLFVALQHILSAANHWLAATRRKIPTAYRDSLVAMGELGVLDQALAQRLARASGLRNLIAHRYGVIDWQRVYTIAATDLGDLEQFCDAVERAERPQ